jgi:hypothetical protein
MGLEIIDVVLLGEKFKLLVEYTGLGATDPRSEMVRQKTADGVASIFKVSFHTETRIYMEYKVILHAAGLGAYNEAWET